MSSDLSKHVGTRIRQARLEMGLRTQRELAQRFANDAVNNQRISDWERGVNRPSERYMHELAQITGKDVSWFYFTPPVPEPPEDGGDEHVPQLDRIELLLREVLTRLPVEIAQEAARQRPGKPAPSRPSAPSKKRKAPAA